MNDDLLARTGRNAFITACAAITFAAVVWTSWVVGPSVERFLTGPVVTKMRIVDLTGDGARTFVSIEFQKLRDCEFVGIAWYVKTDGAFERVPILLHQPRGDGMYTRPVGVQRAGPWEVSLTPRQLIGFSFVKMYHRCHGLWTTETDFYP